MRIAHINVTANLSTGRIAADLCRIAQREGHQVLLCYGRGPAPSGIPALRVGDTPDVLEGVSFRRSAGPKRIFRRLTRRIHNLSAKGGVLMHAGLSRITDRSGFYSRRATRRFIDQLTKFQPELIHLHNIHGYYLHVPTLFEYLKESGIPVVWTLHDSWAYTGHCAYYHFPIEPYLRPEDAPAPHWPEACLLWQKRCNHCPLKKTYPVSLLMDQSARNYAEKKDLFTSLPREQMTLATPSRWLHDQVTKSFLSRYPVRTLPNGIDLKTYAPCNSERTMQDIALFYGLDQLEGRRLVLSVAAVWDDRKGLCDLVELARMLGEDYCVVPVGLSEQQINALPYYMLGLPRTRNVRDLCVLYTAADVYISMSQGETMGMTLLEAMACGTQVICYNSTAMPELIIPQCGEVVPTGDICAAADAVRRLCEEPKDPLFCIGRAAQYGMNLRYEGYLKLYEEMAGR